MRILNLVIKDLVQIFRERLMLIFILVMPFVFTLFMGMAFRGAAEEPDPRLPVGLINKDPSGLLSVQLYEMLQNSATLRLVELDETETDQASEQVYQGQLAAALVIPSGFSEQALVGQTPHLTLLVDRSTSAGQSVYQVIQTSFVRTLSAARIAQLSLSSIDAGQPVITENERQDILEESMQQAAAQWQEPILTVDIEDLGEAVQNSPGLGGNPYNQSSPGIMVQFAIFGLIGSSSILVQERKTRTLQRLLTTSMSRAEIIAGHTLATFCLVFFQGLLLTVFGQLFLKVDYWREPLAILMILAAMSLWIAAMGLLIGSKVASEDQVVVFSLIAMFVFSGLGGAWFPLEGTGRAFSAIGHLTPSAWAMEGFQNILIRGQGLGSVLLPVAILLVYALAFFGLSIWKFKVE